MKKTLDIFNYKNKILEMYIYTGKKNFPLKIEQHFHSHMAPLIELILSRVLIPQLMSIIESKFWPSEA